MNRVLAVLFLFLLAAASRAEDEKTFTLDLADRTLADAAADLAKQSGVPIVVDTELADRKLTGKIEALPLADAVARLAKTAGMEVEAVEWGGGWRLRLRDWRDRVKARLEARVNVNFTDTRLADALGFLRNYADIAVVLDPAVRKEKSEDELLVNLQAEDVTVKNVLGLLTLTKGLAWDVRWGGVFVSTEARLKSLPKDALPPAAADAPEWETKLRERLAGPVSFSFADATVPQALEFLRTLKGVNIVLSPDAKEAAERVPVTLEVSGVQTADALALLLYPNGFTFRLKSEVVLVEKAKEE